MMLLDSDAFDNFDILFTDTLLPFDSLAIREYKTLFDDSVEKSETGRIISIKRCTVIDLRQCFFACTSSFVIHRNAIVKLYNFLQQEIRMVTLIRLISLYGIKYTQVKYVQVAFSLLSLRYV